LAAVGGTLRAHPTGMKTNPSSAITVAHYMTRSPLTIGTEQTLALAHELMREHRLRHLPVLAHGNVVGILSLGDLHLVETLRDVEPEGTQVEEAMSEPYTVATDTPLVQVVRHLEEHKLECALVLDGRHLVGIFTTQDALRALREHLGERHQAAPQSATSNKRHRGGVS
jgi:acetoin utilization protein AcuB